MIEGNILLAYILIIITLSMIYLLMWNANQLNKITKTKV